MDTTLKTIIANGLASFTSLFSAPKVGDSIIGIDIGTSAIKIVQLKSKGGKAILETYGAIALGPYASAEIGTVTNLQPAEIVKALIDVLRESNTTTKKGIIAIPSSSSLIFIITLPESITEDKLASIVPIEARKYIPVPASEISLDWFLIPKEEAESFGNTSNTNMVSSVDRKAEVLVVAIHNDILTRYQEILMKTDLRSESFELEIFSNIRSTFNRDLAPVLLMDFGASKTKLSIVEAGVVRTFHVVNRGSADITHNIAQALTLSFPEAEKLKRDTGIVNASNKQVADIVRASLDYIFADTHSVVLAYEKKYNKSISKIILTGGGSLVKGLREAAVDSFHTEVLYADPFTKTEAPAFLQPVLTLSGPEFSVAVGLALRSLS
jgi:type IV pilus assembly protein PilM